MQKGITIGICDDNAADRDKLQKFCERVLKDMEMDNHTFYLFQSAEEVLYYCENMKNKRIDGSSGVMVGEKYHQPQCLSGLSDI